MQSIFGYFIIFVLIVLFGLTMVNVFPFILFALWVIVEKLLFNKFDCFLFLFNSFSFVLDFSCSFIFIINIFSELFLLVGTFWLNLFKLLLLQYPNIQNFIFLSPCRKIHFLFWDKLNNFLKIMIIFLEDAIRWQILHDF